MTGGQVARSLRAGPVGGERDWRRSLVVACVGGLCLGAGLLLGTGALAESADLTVGQEVVLPEAGEGADESATEPVSEIGLDQLLVLPNAGSYGAETRQGATPQKWRRRFAEADRAVAAAQKRIDDAREELDQLSSGGSSQWQMAPPGSAANSDAVPMSLEQREEIRAGKEELDEAKRDRRALTIEADLAGVPEAWRASDNSVAGGSGR